MKTRAFGLCSLAMLLVTPVASAQSPSATTVLANVQHFYAGVNALTATFRQTVANATFKTSKTSDGRLWVLKPSDFRWDYLEKRNGVATVVKSFVLDGTTLWFVDHANKQIFEDKTQAGVLPAALSFVTNGPSLVSQFTASLDTSDSFGTKGTVVLELTPIQPSTQYKRLFLVVDEHDWHVTESIVVDSSGNRNDFRFYAPDLASPVKATLFQVNPASLPTYKLTQVNQASSGAGTAGKIVPSPGNAGSAAGRVPKP